MSNLKKYNKAFCESFVVDADNISGLEYQSVPDWDSVGHMNLMACIEEAFGIELDTDDIIDFSSYKVGKDILEKYGVVIGDVGHG